MIFYLGTHHPSQRWFDLGVPLFISRVTLAGRKRLPQAREAWCLDSAGFTALHKPPHRYTITVEQYAEEILRYADEIGRLQWAAPMDFMCEPSAVANTGLTVERHQHLTIENFLALRELVGALAIPVLQGWEQGEHEAHIGMYEDAGVNLFLEPTVGVGSICRRNSDREILTILRGLVGQGIGCHAFGVRSAALGLLGDDLTSADSMAWSARGRRMKLKDCPGHKSEANCPRWAMMWRQQQLDRTAQLRLMPPHVEPYRMEATA